MAKCCLDLGTDKSFWNVSINQKVPMLKMVQFRDFREIFFLFPSVRKRLIITFFFKKFWEVVSVVVSPRTLSFLKRWQ